MITLSRSSAELDIPPMWTTSTTTYSTAKTTQVELPLWSLAMGTPRASMAGRIKMTIAEWSRYPSQRERGELREESLRWRRLRRLWVIEGFDGSRWILKHCRYNQKHMNDILSELNSIFLLTGGGWGSLWDRLPRKLVKVNCIHWESSCFEKFILDHCQKHPQDIFLRSTPTLSVRPAFRPNPLLATRNGDSKCKSVPDVRTELSASLFTPNDGRDIKTSASEGASSSTHLQNSRPCSNTGVHLGRLQRSSPQSKLCSVQKRGFLQGYDVDRRDDD